MTLVLALGLASWLAWMPVQAADGDRAASPSAVADSAEPAYVGAQVCAECHSQEAARWSGSYHDQAMAEAGEQTVLGDFNDAAFTAHGLTSRFFRRDGRYWVETEGPGGAPETYPIRYTFGRRPLQQYLIEFPGGRLQSLGIAWDSRDREDGGQRWFQLYPDERLDATHPLHWTGREQNWNYQCAECHSTNLRKGYDLATDSFRTTWSEINVACEACHGPGARHVAQVRSDRGDGTPAWDRDKGLTVALDEQKGAVWLQDDATGRPRRSPARETHRELNVCARCHSRRGLLREGVTPDAPLGDSHRLALLDTGLYHADGQIQGEVYEYGSFLQSRMYQHGVTCTDCHDPHSLTLKAPGDRVCAQCHQPERYDTERHHHHPVGSEGASCIACHMPQTLYMVVDARADHSLRIPRPDLTRKIGTPNVCNGCHADRTVDWAEQTTLDWYGAAISRRPHFGEALQAGRTGAPDADARLLTLATDADQPNIARATALSLLNGPLDAARLERLHPLLKDPDDLVRAAALGVLDQTDPGTRMELAWPRLEDAVLAVRVEAARILAPLAGVELTEDVRARLAQGLDEYRATQLANAERPESHLNLGLLDSALGQPEAAEQAYRTALRLDPNFAPAYVNLADLYRALGRDTDGEVVLQQGLERLPDAASLHHALGLLRVRQGQLPAAVESLGQAVRLAPENARYAYVQALALERAGQSAEAIAALRAALERHPNDRDILAAIRHIERASGDRERLSH
ncbi:tetratricopeptide repeat protein [Allochromatium humboldtianum]|uniref:Tetratricopeptide repeat protein n=1 Tax=Allochromatium humboldtianum TaxID=504901 RepID=A0A850RB45_9GAMM|nr:tetratricopeptide repeat protein [Allochromatium humboldtianum]NVZ11194.1 tetratricopeptide repeat protein [Allochromatium humboldtianum]